MHLQLANECLMVSYGFLPSILQVWVAEGWQVWGGVKRGKTFDNVDEVPV